MTKLIRIVITIVFIVLETVSCVRKDVASNTCTHLEEIGNDSDKVRYLRTWFRESIKDKEFFSHFSYVGYLSAFGAVDRVESLGLDWPYIGIDVRYATISLYHPELSKIANFDTSDIRYVGVGLGREEVVIELNPPSVSEGDAIRYNQSGAYKYLGNGVYLFCTI